MRGLFALLILLGANLAHAGEFKAFGKFARPDAFRSGYVEEKHLPSLSAPLKSSGDFIYIKDRGLGWMMKAPFDMQTVITPRGLDQWVEGVRQPQSKETRTVMAPILRNISAIFAGDFEALETQFEINDVDGGGISLRPKSENLQRYLQEILIYGDGHIERIKIINAPDQYTVTTFKEPVVGSEHISADEALLFDE